MPSYLGDYIYYSSGNETPTEYLTWGGLSILGHILGRKVNIAHGGYFNFHPNLLVCLVGEAGSGKNTALSVNMDIMADHFPKHLISASIQSREDITYQMGDDLTGVLYYTPEGLPIQSFRPFYILNNELASFLSVDKLKMVEFLTEIFDGKRFGTGFKKDRQENPKRQQWFSNPHLSLIAGAVPSWFMNSLKMDLFSGGLGRRMIIVNAVRDKIIPFPKKPAGADEALSRAVLHLKEAEKFQATITLGADACKWWESWYIAHRKQSPTDPIVYQFHQTMHMQILKLALLAYCTEKLEPGQITGDHLEFGKVLFSSLIPSVQRLTAGIGRNELAGVGAQLIDMLDRTGGMATEIQVKKAFHRYANTREFQDIIEHYKGTGELTVMPFTKDGVAKMFYFTPQGLEEARRIIAEISKPKE